MPGEHTMDAFKPLMLPPNGSYPGSIALRDGDPIKKRVVVKPNKVDTFLFQVSFFPIVDLLAEYSLCLTARSKFLVQLLHIMSLDNLEQKERNTHFESCTTSIPNMTVVKIYTKVEKTYYVSRQSKFTRNLKWI